MTHDGPYNVDWTDMDTQILLHYATIMTLPQNRPYRCCWETGHAQICSLVVQGAQFSEHLRTHHGIAGSDKTLVRCYWNGCYMEMKRESLLRHVNERHLELKYGCPCCSEQFTRPYTMQNHVSKKHSNG